MRIILASASPRRKEILAKLVSGFEIICARKEEICSESRPDVFVQELSRQKALEVEQSVCRDGCAQGKEDYLIIGADTAVACNGRILGKPRDDQDAEDMLRLLSGKKHQVYTGVTVILQKGGSRRCIETAECTDVVFYPMTDNEIRDYVKTGEPMGKAGSYAIQGIGGRFVERIEGNYDNVVGLPAAKLYQLLKDEGIRNHIPDP